MRVLFAHLMPFALAPGGRQVQITQSRVGLETLGIEVEFLRWWDETQSGDVLHHFGRMPSYLVRTAQQKGFKVVVSDWLADPGYRSPARARLQRILRRAMGRALSRRFDWDSYRLADACLALSEWEALLLQELFHVASGKIRVVPGGVEDVFLRSPPARRGPWLVCSAAITERKRVLELAEAAVRARTPLWVIGKPHSEANAYAQRLAALAKAHPGLLRYEGPIQDRARLAQVYREARGFVLLSGMESLSLSALEAAACECPLLLSRLPWATTVFRENACYCPITSAADQTAGYLRQFYDAAPGLKPPPPLSWIEVARKLKTIYESLLDRRV